MSDAATAALMTKIKENEKMYNLIETIERAEEGALSLLPGYKISISNRQGRYIVDLRTRLFIRRAITAALRHEYIPEDRFAPEVSVVLVSDSRIHKLNMEKRGVDRATDVLSFPLLQDGIPTEEDIDPRTGRIPLGDIVISLDRAHAQAQEYGHSFKRELAFLCVHSVLHLLGYDHESDEDERIMFDCQREILDGMGLSR